MGQSAGFGSGKGSFGSDAAAGGLVSTTQGSIVKAYGVVWEELEAIEGVAYGDNSLFWLEGNSQAASFGDRSNESDLSSAGIIRDSKVGLYVQPGTHSPPLAAVPDLRMFTDPGVNVGHRTRKP